MRGRRLLLGVLAGALVPAAATPAQAATVETIREATGADPAAITATVGAFRADMGEPNNGNTTGSLPSGRREINWEVSDTDAAPARFPGDFFNSFVRRGAVVSTPTNGFQVSADATPAVPGTVSEFGNLNTTYPTAFQPFSSARMFTALATPLNIVRFFIPGSDIPRA